MKTRTYFAFRIDVWDDAGDNIFEHVVGSEDFEVAVAAYFAACQRWPKAKITLRQGARVVKRNWRCIISSRRVFGNVRPLCTDPWLVSE
jgi:hypothetical protein